MPLNTFLRWLIWLCVLPLFLLAAYLAIDSILTSKSERDIEAETLVKNTAIAIDQRLNARISTLQMLAGSPLADDASRRKDFYQEAQGFHQHFGSHVVLADPEMHMLFNTRVPFGTRLPMLPRPKGHAAAPTALETGIPAVGDLFFGPIAKEPLIAIAVPGQREGKTAFLLLATFEARQFQTRLERVVLPSGWALSLLDSNGATIARHAPPGPNSAANLDAAVRFDLKSAVSPWTVRVEIPRDVYYAPLIEAAVMLVGLILLATLAGVVGGRLAGRRLAKTIGSLTEKPVSGAPLPGIAEIATVRRLLDEAMERHTAAEAAVRAGEAQMRFVTDHAPVSIAHCDQERRYKFVNQHYAAMFGLRPADIVGKHPREVLGDEAYAHASPYMEAALTGQSVTYDLVLPTAVAGPRSLQVSYAPELNASGRVVGFIAAILDITERKRAEAALQALNAEMEQLMRFHVANQTVAAIAHELNQPLSAVATYAEAALRMLRAGNPQPDRLQHALESSAQQAQRAGGVVRELLAFLKKGEVPTEPADLNEVVHGALDRIMANGYDGFHVRLELEPGLASVSANRLQIEKVLANLMQNGIEAMRDAGVSTQSITITVHTCAEEGMAQVTVSDSGPGVDARTLHRIFDPFFTTKPKGLGMGLSISRAIIEAHGGRLWVEPEPGSGASFHFTLPFAS